MHNFFFQTVSIQFLSGSHLKILTMRKILIILVIFVSYSAARINTEQSNVNDLRYPKPIIVDLNPLTTLRSFLNFTDVSRFSGFMDERDFFNKKFLELEIEFFYEPHSVCQSLIN